MVFTNKKPEWNEEIEGYMLNFGGKVKKSLSEELHFGGPEQSRKRKDGVWEGAWRRV